MTIDERLERLEHYTAGLGEMFLKEREESRQLWRETQQEIASLSRKVNDIADQFLVFQRQADERHRQTEERFRETDERFRETDERFRQTDERINTLVSAIGEWIRKSSS